MYKVNNKLKCPAIFSTKIHIGMRLLYKDANQTFTIVNIDKDGDVSVRWDAFKGIDTRSIRLIQALINLDIYKILP